MISKKHRFRGLGSLRFVYRRGTNVRGNLFSVRVIQNNRQSTYRAAVVVSRKVNKSAVIRNRIRRRLYEAVRSLENQISQPHDIVISVFSDQLLSTPHNEIIKELKKVLTRAGVIS